MAANSLMTVEESAAQPLLGYRHMNQRDLVVDDEIGAREMLASELLTEGFDVKTAAITDLRIPSTM